MIMPALRRNAHVTNYHGELRRIGLLIDDRGIPAHRSHQRGTSSRLREVGVRLGMRDHHVNGIAGRRQVSDVNPDHVNDQVGGEGPARELARWRLGTRPDLLVELDKTAWSKQGSGQVYRCVRVDVIHLGAVNDQVVE